MPRNRTVIRDWPADPESIATLTSPRSDLVVEDPVVEGLVVEGPATTDEVGTRRFEQRSGPFSRYRRTVDVGADRIAETTTYRLTIPWFGWLFTLPVRWHLARRWSGPRHRPRAGWWAPPDVLTARDVLVLGLLAAASMSSAFTNTLFTQTAQFAADDFGVDDTTFGIAGAIVRAGIVVALPLAVVADRIGRRRVMSIAAWAAPTICALGALAPSFPALVATQAIGRPLGLALDLLIAVVVAEEMPRNSRAYALSVMAMASGLGAGIAVMVLPLADLGSDGWRYVYVVTLVWLVVAVDIVRRLPETRRFERPHVVAPRLDRRRLAILGVVAVSANLFVAPASFFQNRYLADVRGFDASTIALFTLTTATPAGIGLIVGGKLADLRGRRRVIAVAVPVATVLVVTSFTVAGVAMWSSAFGGGFIAGIAVPALAVYRAELFPTGNRGRAAGILTATALLGGIVGLLGVGALLDQGWAYGRVMSLVAVGQLVVVLTVLFGFPETAHRELEDLNPLDRITPDRAPDPRSP